MIVHTYCTYYHIFRNTFPIVYIVLMPGINTNILKLNVDIGLSLFIICIRFKKTDNTYITDNSDINVPGNTNSPPLSSD